LGFFFGRVIFFGQKTTCLPKWLAVGIFFLAKEFVSSGNFFAKGILPGLGLGAGQGLYLGLTGGEGGALLGLARAGKGWRRRRVFCLPKKCVAKSVCQNG
jgi:hypothetical protein